MKRVVTPELLDSDLGTRDEIQNSLEDLRGINENFGGFSSVAAMLRTIAEKTSTKSITFLDIAGGTGEVAHQASRLLQSDGIQVHSAVLDRSVSHMIGGRSKLARVAGDALAVPFASESFDVVGCNLFCHHLEPQDMISFFEEGLRVARIAVIASDLRRNLLHWIAAYGGWLTYRSRLTRNDAPASVRRAYTTDEIVAIAKGTTAARYDVQKHYFQRFGLTLWKAQP